MKTSSFEGVEANYLPTDFRSSKKVGLRNIVEGIGVIKKIRLKYRERGGGGGGNNFYMSLKGH